MTCCSTSSRGSSTAFAASISVSGLRRTVSDEVAQLDRVNVKQIEPGELHVAGILFVYPLADGDVEVPELVLL
jgi:hypothetical protein